jgi:hypothetical protein
VPTTTSERWLRAFALEEGEETPYPLPEEEAVIAALGAELGLASEDETLRAIEATEAAQTDAVDRVDPLQAEIDERYALLRIALLERWPVLDDPFRADFEPTLADHGRAIDAFLEAREEPRAIHALESRAAPDHQAIDAADVKLSRLHRLSRAYETRRLAARLHHAAGIEFERYEQLLRCERRPL